MRDQLEHPNGQPSWFDRTFHKGLVKLYACILIRSRLFVQSVWFVYFTLFDQIINVPYKLIFITCMKRV